MSLRITTVLAAFLSSGCAIDMSEVGREPRLAPIGAGVWTEKVDIATPPPALERPVTKGSVWNAKATQLFSDVRAMTVGDVVTVNISIDDKASLDTKTNRSRKATRDAGVNYTYGYEFPSGAASGNLDGKIGLDGSTSTDGKGKTSRAERVALNVAAIVTEVLPNGNLLISGSQEVRVNYELRVVSVAGVVRPRDISPANTISYEKIAEARVSYGGRGRTMEVQQPGWGQQIIDAISPM